MEEESAELHLTQEYPVQHILLVLSHAFRCCQGHAWIHVSEVVLDQGVLEVLCEVEVADWGDCEDAEELPVDRGVSRDICVLFGHT